LKCYLAEFGNPALESCVCHCMACADGDQNCGEGKPACCEGLASSLGKHHYLHNKQATFFADCGLEIVYHISATNKLTSFLLLGWIRIDALRILFRGAFFRGYEFMKKIRKAVFPVAGLGTRFLPATKALPKEMLTVVDRPVIQYVVDEAREAGIEHFIFVTGRNKTAIEDHFDVQVELYETLQRRGKTAILEQLEAMQPKPGQTSFTRQQVPLGLGHAVWCARELVADEPFALLLPDMIMQSEPGCLKEMVQLYEDTGGNVLAVEQCDPSETYKYGIV